MRRAFSSWAMRPARYRQADFLGTSLTMIPLPTVISRRCCPPEIRRRRGVIAHQFPVVPGDHRIVVPSTRPAIFVVTAKRCIEAARLPGASPIQQITGLPAAMRTRAARGRKLPNACGGLRRPSPAQISGETHQPADAARPG